MDNQLSAQYIYARVSTLKQNLEPQVNELTKSYPNATLVREKASGKDLRRTEFELLNEKLNQGDIVIVYDLSRLGRNTADLINLVEDWNKRGISLIVQNLGGSVVDTSTATGKLMFTVLAAVGQMQREIQQEKAQLGIEKAISEGKFKGKQQSQKTVEACKKAMEYLDKGLSKEAAAKAVGIGVATLYRWIKDNK
ncbi:recombinase family protein [Vibrio scophthalmi]|uniref:Transposon Tn21 resolvase n=1 Tax=Vibrio scophthalmi TaxID=45658 RepID=A0A1E3WQA7_9VIBR|nr:recombinase family protein [Vibrio scophthalmi]ODS11943.1 Transposon Tn21 resolvase [Vibrio scophthalmi]